MAGKNGFYVIGCKLASGLVIEGAGQRIKLNGAPVSHLVSGDGKNIVHGFGLTENVPVEVWDEFAKNHADSAFMKKGLVFATSDERSAKAAAKDNEKQKTGTEQLDGSKQATKADKE